MNILFLGGAGFIGSKLIREFCKHDDYNVFVLDPAENISRIEGLAVKKIYKDKLSDIDAIKKILASDKIDTVVHLISTLIPGSTYADFINDLNNVVFPSIRLMEHCAQVNIKFVFFSSGGSVYGDRKVMRPFVEVDEMAPISYYGWSKQIIENAILFKNRTAKMNYLIVRPSNPYGIGQNLYGKQGLVAVAIGKIMKGLPVEVWGDGSAIRDYIHVDDVARIFFQLIDRNVSNQAMNIGSGIGYSVNDVLAMLKRISNTDFQIEYKNARPMDVSTIVLDTTKMKSYVDVDLIPLADGMKQFYQEVVNNIK